MQGYRATILYRVACKTKDKKPLEKPSDVSCPLTTNLKRFSLYKWKQIF